MTNLHPGGIASDGCHNNRQTGERHCHRGPSAEQRNEENQGATGIVSEGQTFRCTPTAVWDGDGPVWCAEGPRIRLSGIAAREMDGACRRGHPCPSVSGEAARDALVRLIGTPTGVGRHGHIEVQGPTMQCLSDGSGVGRRTAAWCISPKSGDINCAMVQGGWALRWDRYWGNHTCRS